MIKKIYFILIMLILFACTKEEKDPGKKARKIKFENWHEAIIPKDSILIADDKIADIRKGLFRTGIDIEVLKNAYVLNGYREELNDENKRINFIKDNIKIQFIIVDEKAINIMIDILPQNKFK